MFRARYADVYTGDERWRAIEITGGETYAWPAASTYIQNPPYFTGMTHDRRCRRATSPTRGALAVFGDSITTDHISPAGAIKARQPGRQISDRRQACRGPSSTATARGAATMK